MLPSEHNAGVSRSPVSPSYRSPSTPKSTTSDPPSSRRANSPPPAPSGPSSTTSSPVQNTPPSGTPPYPTSASPIPLALPVMQSSQYTLAQRISQDIETLQQETSVLSPLQANALQIASLAMQQYCNLFQVPPKHYTPANSPKNAIKQQEATINACLADIDRKREGDFSEALKKIQAIVQKRYRLWIFALDQDCGIIIACHAKYLNPKLLPHSAQVRFEIAKAYLRHRQDPDGSFPSPTPICRDYLEKRCPSGRECKFIHIPYKKLYELKQHRHPHSPSGNA